MIVAELQMLTSNGLIAAAHGQHNIQFDDMTIAESEYARIMDLMERRDSKANDIPTLVEVIGSGSKVSFPLADLRAIALSNFVDLNLQRFGLKEAFPNLYKM